MLAVSRARRVKGQRVFERLYPHGDLAAHVGGLHVGRRSGKTGIESTYNRYLSGSFGTEPLLQRLNLKEKQGADVQLSIDTRVQQVAEEGLAGKRGAVVALDPRTGQVLAMASSPDLRPAAAVTRLRLDPDRAARPFINRATAGLYPPGSTFKVVTADRARSRAASSRPSSHFDDTGSYDTPGGPIHNFGGEIFGTHDLTRRR